MKNKCKYFILFILMVNSVNHVTGQETNFATNVKKSLSMDGKGLTIEYDLVFPDTTQRFDIILKIDRNGSIIQPLDNDLHGDWGNRLKPGMGKAIIWDFPDDFKGNINELKVDVIAIKTIRPLAGFSSKILTSKPPFNVEFTNTSKDADKYSWDFGDLKSDQNLSTLKSPFHAFKSAGNYNIKLIALNSKNKTSDTTMKVIALGSGNEQELQKHKKLKNIWMGSAIASAGIGTFALIKSNSLWDDWTNEGSDELKQKSKTYGVIGYTALVVSGVSITQVIIQSKKIRAAEQAMKMSFIPLEKGGIVALAWTF